MLTITHRWACDICQETLEEPMGGYQPEMSRVCYNRPYGWNWIDGRLICSKHTITIDGDEPDGDNP